MAKSAKRDKTRAQAGVTKAKLEAGEMGKTSVSVSAQGAAVAMPVPYSLTEVLDLDTDVTVQLVNDETATCWTSTFAVAKKNDGSPFKASAP